MSTEPIASSLLAALGGQLDLLDDIYAAYLRDPQSVDSSWQALFSQKDFSLVPSGAAKEKLESKSMQSFNSSKEQMLWLSRVQALVYAYRKQGHLQADLDPLHQETIPRIAELDPASYGLTTADLEQTLPEMSLYGLEGYEGYQVRDLIAHLQNVYCGVIGAEFMDILDPKAQDFILANLEHSPAFLLDTQTKLRIVDLLIAAESFERFVHTKYLGAKRFSLEGGESLIPLLDLLFEQAKQEGISDIVLGMAHRGRLNVLTHLFGKPPSVIFSEFEDFSPQNIMGLGDVKYHLGYSRDDATQEENILHLSLSFNPSHLEVVDSVVLGRVRAKQHRLKDNKRTKVLGVLLHGDAAFAGQGIVTESLNLSLVRGYRIGGTVHIIINNQIGFTTSQKDSRSTRYCTDVAKMLQVPIFHVNGDDPEAVAKVIKLARSYQQSFQKDVVIDLVCYRKYGHNETDEPSFTQPIMYQSIANHPSVATLYGQKLVTEGTITQSTIEDLRKKHQEFLESELAKAKTQAERPKPSSLQGVWKGYFGGPSGSATDPDTGVSQEQLAKITTQMTALPSGFSANSKILRLLEQRASMSKGEHPLDWAMGELLAYGSLLWEGVPIRLTGQDCRRGTFSHRQALIVDTKTGAERIPLQELAGHGEQQPGDFQIYDSTLSEVAALGFEYGYSLDCPEGLTLWEAQFGDFVNGAQVVLDQYLSAAEAKWTRLSGLVLLLPHGYEGQGPEHSSARLERFLQLCAEDNMQVTYPTTPAQFFHLLRRQVKRPWRKPLIVMTPKSLLRHPLATSPIGDLTQGHFQPILPDVDVKTSSVERIILCSGKIYYDLLEERTRRKDIKTALVRLEQLYPLDVQLLQSILGLYPKAKEICLTQEEPANMGSQSFLLPLLQPLLGSLRLRIVSRPAAASPATGSHKAHVLEQKKILDEVFGKESEPTTKLANQLPQEKLNGQSSG